MAIAADVVNLPQYCGPMRPCHFPVSGDHTIGRTPGISHGYFHYPHNPVPSSKSRTTADADVTLHRACSLVIEILRQRDEILRKTPADQPRWTLRTLERRKIGYHLRLFERRWLTQLVLPPEFTGRDLQLAFEGDTHILGEFKTGALGDFAQGPVGFHQQRFDPVEPHPQDFLVERPAKEVGETPFQCSAGDEFILDSQVVEQVFDFDTVDGMQTDVADGLGHMRVVNGQNVG